MFKNNHKMTLKEILCHIPYNNNNWYIFEINAIGMAPNNMSMQEFEELVLSSDFGYQITWSELLTFADNINDIDNFIVVWSDIPITFNLIENKFKIKIEVYDSDYWEITYSDDVRI
ncbi:hypothetical protein KG090_04360 [Carnobacteriaceae bacterium zg-ZUI240]|nr:hypothetical protein [Carnobacteriaceae bacterium zg-ZUI240]